MGGRRTIVFWLSGHVDLNLKAAVSAPFLIVLIECICKHILRLGWYCSEPFIQMGALEVCPKPSSQLNQLKGTHLPWNSYIT